MGECFVERFEVAGAAEGPLAGLTFAAKDLFDVAGRVTGAGNPDWAASHPAATTHAAAVALLLEAGARLVGKTITDEISLGLLGVNAFDGTPLNPRAPDRAPGGSSSGSASAVAQGLCDAALGTDTGGSVRTPASFCGLYGLRPTHGRVPTAGMLPQAPGSDTAGWFARRGDVFARVGAVLIGEAPSAPPRGLSVAADAFGFAGPGVAEALAPALARLEAIVGPGREELLAPPGLAAWGRAQRTLQSAEAWQTFGPWVEATVPRFSFLVARSLMAGAATPPAELPPARLVRDEARGRLAHLTRGGACIALPATPDPAPKLGLPLSQMDRARDRINAICALGGLTGHPVLVLPGGEAEGAPVGLAVIGARGADASLLALAQIWEDA
ncbi:amidase [uncultured Albimonas sp.]|uniref:amidase n=1 Tax=uncultured Albimonas sp. TaxID=1331701 RepID=UPI0030EBBD29|tara:strand:+ start:4579 stop:5733 length:1155 start_codon:yes stop_codon:yes gene_type:complete